MFNSREYEFADINLILGGAPIVGIRDIKYTEKQEKELLHAKGNLPHSIQKGNITFEGTLTILQSDYETLVEAGKGSVLNIELDAIIAYGNPSNGDTIITDKVAGLQFTEGPKGMKQGDKFAEHALPFIFLRLHNHVV